MVFLRMLITFTHTATWKILKGKGRLHYTFIYTPLQTNYFFDIEESPCLSVHISRKRKSYELDELMLKKRCSIRSAKVQKGKQPFQIYINENNTREITICAGHGFVL